MGKLKNCWKRKPYGHIRPMQWNEKSCSESGSSESYDEHIIYTTLNDASFPDLEHDITDLSDDPYLDIKLEESCSAKIGSVLKEVKQLRGCQIFDPKKRELNDSVWDEKTSPEPSDCESISDSVSTVSREPLFPGLPPLPRPTPKAPPPTPTGGQPERVGECREDGVFDKTSATCSSSVFGIRYPSNSLICTFGKQPFLHLKHISLGSIKQGKEGNVAGKGGNVAAISKKNGLVFKAPQQTESRLQVTEDKLAAEKEASISHLLDKLKSRHNLTQDLGRGSTLAKTTKPNTMEGRRLTEENYARLDDLLARPALHLKMKLTEEHPQKLIVRTAPSRKCLPMNTSKTTFQVERPYTYGRYRRTKE